MVFVNQWCLAGPCACCRSYGNTEGLQCSFVISTHCLQWQKMIRQLMMQMCVCRKLLAVQAFHRFNRFCLGLSPGTPVVPGFDHVRHEHLLYWIQAMTSVVSAACLNFSVISPGQSPDRKRHQFLYNSPEKCLLFEYCR